MYEYKLVGKQFGLFTPKGETEGITYYKLYVISQLESKGVIGYKTDVLKCDGETYDELNIGEEFTPAYNKYGRVIGVM